MNLTQPNERSRARLQLIAAALTGLSIGGSTNYLSSQKVAEIAVADADAVLRIIDAEDNSK